MANFTIKGMSDELLQNLRESADLNRRSINSEVLLRLERSLGRTPVDPDEFLARIRARRERLHLPHLTDESLNQAKAEGRP